MADNKKYYYLKLKENFYDSEEMILLQNMPDGYLYSDILMKLYLRSLKNEGKLMFKDVIPYTPTVLAQVVRHQIGTVEKALQIFREIGLVEILDNGAIYMSDIQNFIGKSSTEGDRKRNYRAKIKEEKLLSGHLPGHLSDNRPPEIEIEIEIEKDIEKNIKKRDKNISMEALHAIIDAYTPNEQLNTELKNHLEVRKLKKSALTRRAVELSLQKLDSLVENLPAYKQEQEKIKIVQQSIDSGWIGFFEIKNRQQPKQKTALKSSFGNLEDFYDN